MLNYENESTGHTRSSSFGAKKCLIAALLACVAVLVFGELAMRWYGFCSSPLYYNNEYSGYSLVPNQDVLKLRNRYSTNEFSMRSAPLNEGEHRITLVGDSVLNGGVQTDQDKLASTMLENELQSKFGENMRVLNVSCGGWGIDNAAGVFKQYGDFNSELIVIVMNSCSAVETMSENEVAGKNKNFPAQQYSLAWVELFDRYLIPKIYDRFLIHKNGGYVYSDYGEELSEGWNYFYELCRDRDIPLIIYLHARRSECYNGGYSENGQRIINFAKEHNIRLITDIDSVEYEDYRDDVHLTENGQHVIFDILKPVLNDFVEEKLND